MSVLKCQIGPDSEIKSGGDQGLLHTSFELPPLKSRFPLRLHPERESIREECESWGLSLMGTANSAAEREAFLNGKYHLLGTVFYPLACSRRRLLLLTKLTIFNFIFDDVMELTPPAEAAWLLRAALAVWTGEPGLRSSDATAAEAQMAVFLERFRKEVWEEMCQDMTPAFQTSLESMLLDWLHHAGADQHPVSHLSVDECLTFRMFVGGIEAFFMFVQYSLDIDIGDQFTSIPVLAQLRKHLLNHYFWVNDLLSFRKEVLQNGGYGKGTVGVLIVQAARASSTGEYDLQGIINKLWEMIQAEEAIIAGLVEEIEGQFPPSSDIFKFVEALCVTLATNMYWYAISGRYGLHVQFLNTEDPTKLETSPTIVSLNLDPTLQVTLKSLPFAWKE